MKRLFSISTMLMLLFSAFSPTWAADMDSMQASSCHRMPMQGASAKHHHCDGMDKEAAQTSDGVSVGSNHSHSCPMNCCVQVAPKSGVVTATVSVLPPLAVVEAEFDFSSIIFASAGFSSHTDRGPPAA
jgi:hypothetical protein